MKTNLQRAIDRTVRAMRKSAIKREVESLSQDEIVSRMSEVIAEQVGEKGTVSREDFRRAGIPLPAILANFSRAMARARDADPSLGKLECVA